MENKENKAFTIALAGNPNCGKTTIFNALTGSNQHVGNYSGVTVEKKDGKFKHEDLEVTVIDLPGTYSLNYHSPEERIAQQELLSGKVDMLVAIVDSGSLSRSLLFVAQLMQLHLPMILCLNMWDEAEKAGLELDLDKMKSLLGMPVIPTVASHGRGIDELKKAIIEQDQSKHPAHRLRLGDTISETLKRIIEKLPPKYEKQDEWVATKLLLGDANYTEEISKLSNGAEILKLAKDERTHIEADSKMDIQLYVTEQYYGFVDGMLKEVTLQKQRLNARAVSDKIDRVLVHPILGLPFFLLIVYLLFQLTFTLGQYPMDWIEAGFEALSDLINNNMEEGLLRSLLVDGIIGGVIVFLPNILILFFGLSFLEDSGYMARSAFLMDKLMHRVGLHGRSFIPLITGFGCSIPGLMATRTIAGEKERLTTMYILPLMSCGARLPIWLLLVPVFFPEAWQAPAMMGIYLVGIIVALIAAMCLRKTIFKGQEEPFVMELPPYRLPTFRAAMTHMLERAWLYLKKAGTIILAVSIILWALAVWHPGDYDEDKIAADAMATVEAQYGEQIKSVSPLAFDKFMEEAEAAVEAAEEAEEAEEDNAEEGKADEAKPEDDEAAKLFAVQEEAVSLKNGIIAEADLESSAIGRIGHFIEPVLRPMGFDWKIGTAIIGAFAAKEVFVAQMGIVYKLGETDEESETLRDTLRETYPMRVGIALMLWLLISAPCMATFAVMKRESGSWKHAIAQFVGLTVIAYILATIVNLVGSLFS
ncbi:MAG: ferrous iron transport protein B [Proteobacteria bacterium]|nr:ferrous iron transport protein B [Pseudomonadota bacterium]